MFHLRMVQATELLRKEHRLIQMVLVFLALISENLPEFLSNNPTLVKELFTFLKDFVHQYHHQKEEKILFSLLREIHFPNEEGPMMVMSMEHQFVNTQLDVIQKALDEYLLNQDPNRLTYIYQKLQTYIGFLYEHITKEDYVLFRMVDRLLTPEQQLLLQERLKGYEEKKASMGKRFDETVKKWKTFFWDQKLLVDLRCWEPSDQEELVQEAIAGLEKDGPVVFINDYDLRQLHTFQEIEENKYIKQDWQLEGPHFWVVEVSIAGKSF